MADYRVRMVALSVGLCALACAGDGTGLDEDGNPINTGTNVTVSNPELALPVAATFQLTAEVRDADGNVVTGRPVTWRSSNLTIADVDATGNVTAIRPGAAVISAEADGARGESELAVVPSASFSNAVQPIFSASCALGQCHAAPTLEQNMDLSAGNSFAAIVEVAANELPSMFRVTPGEPEQSYLVHKIRGTQADVGGSGGRMPLIGGPLPQNEIDVIRAWVQVGAPNN